MTYRPGEYWIIDDVTGLKVRSSKTREQWDGSIVDKRYFDERHPQDLIRAIPDNPAVETSRPPSVDLFIGPLITTLTADAAAGAILLFVVSNVRMLIGDRITVFLANDNTFTTYITDSSILGQISISPKLPSKANSGVQVTDYTAIAQGTLP